MSLRNTKVADALAANQMENSTRLNVTCGVPNSHEEKRHKHANTHERKRTEDDLPKVRDLLIHFLRAFIHETLLIHLKFPNFHWIRSLGPYSFYMNDMACAHMVRSDNTRASVHCVVVAAAADVVVCRLFQRKGQPKKKKKRERRVPW